MSNLDLLKNKLTKGIKGKLLLWLSAYLDNSNPKIFLNQTGSAKAAGYKCKDENSFASIGAQNYRKLKTRIEQWLTEAELSEDALKKKLVGLMNAKETRLITLKGKLIKDTLADGCEIVAESTQTKLAGALAIEYEEEHTVIAVNLTAQELQRRTLDMALKVRGMYSNDETGLEAGLAKLGDRLAQAIERTKNE